MASQLVVFYSFIHSFSIPLLCQVPYQVLKIKKYHGISIKIDSVSIVTNRLKITSMAYLKKFISCPYQVCEVHVIAPRQPELLNSLRQGKARLENLVAVIKSFHKDTQALLCAWPCLPSSVSASCKSSISRRRNKTRCSLSSTDFAPLHHTSVQFCQPVQSSHGHLCDFVRFSKY